jgi:F-type H+-transporting ATPase subunit b
MMFFIQDDHGGGVIDDVRDEMTADDGTVLDPGAEVHSEAYYSPLEDTNLWVLVGFLIVIGILISQGVGKKIGGFLSGRARLIEEQLDDARNMREEAQRLLADYQKRQREAEGEAEDIITRAREDAKAMSLESRRKIEEQTTRRTQAAHDRIARAEAQALAEVRAQTADLAVDAAREIVKARTDGSAQKALLDRSIADLRGKLN